MRSRRTVPGSGQAVQLSSSTNGILTTSDVKPKRGLLVRVAADQSDGGGNWNGPVDPQDGSFAYVAIPETKMVRPRMDRPYEPVSDSLKPFKVCLPSYLAGRNMHLDPDFDHLTYGDQGERAKQIRTKLTKGDLIVFYAGLRDVQGGGLVYAIIGLYVINGINQVSEIPQTRWQLNAHTRRQFKPTDTDIVVTAQKGCSGRLLNCIPIGEYRDRAYRVTRPILQEWGGISSKDGYLQRSARLPELNEVVRFYRWFQRQKPTLVAMNNLLHAT